MMNTDWQPTACILCECNCGIEVRLGEDGHTFDRIRGDKAHPASQGYTCERALRLNHYQNGTNRLLSPLRPVRRAGFTGEGLALGEALFDGIVAGHHGITFSVDEWADVSPRVQTEDGLIHVHIAEMVDKLRALAEEPEFTSAEFPLVLSAGERRSFTANTIIRDSSWRKRDADGALRVSSEDAAACGVVDGGVALISTRRGSAQVSVEVSPMMQRGHVSLPNGMGLDEPTAAGSPRAGVAPNELTSSDDRDWIAGTPWHKSVPARLEPIG